MNNSHVICTPDIADDYPEDVQALELDLRNFGAVQHFSGLAVTVKCHEDNSLVKALVATPGNGRVIVVDGGGSRRRALLGDMLAEQAAEHGWSGLIINGVVRDVERLAEISVGVQALGSSPLKTEKLGHGQQDVPLHMGGANIKPGDWIYADPNGVLVAGRKLL